MNYNSLLDWIKKHEGLRLYPYKCTADKLTIGFGRNLQDNGISQQEAELLLENDIQNTIKELEHFEWYNNQPDNVQFALINMCFNLGLTRLLTFKRMIAALEERDYTKASIEALDSRWAKQVKGRATDVACLMREGYGS